MKHTEMLGRSVVLILLLATASYGEQSTAPSKSGANDAVDPTHPAVVFEKLRAAHSKDSKTFVVQKELEPLIDKDGGGACASAAAIDVLQAARLMAGLEEVDNPHQLVLSSFADQQELLLGRVTNPQMARLLEFYEQYLDGASLEVEVSGAPGSIYSIGSSLWSSDAGPDLSVMPGVIKILSFTQTQLDGEVQGRHFVLLKDSSEGNLEIVDPWEPMAKRTFSVELKKDYYGDFERVYFLPPPKVKNPPIRELNTIFTIRVTQSPDPAALNSTRSVEHIKAKISAAEREIRGTGNHQSARYLSPLVWRERTAEFGLPALDLPKEHGGADWSAEKMLEVFKHAGRFNLNFRDVVGGAHSRLLLASKHPVVAEVLKEIVSGPGYMAVAMTEPTAGSDFTAIKSFAKKVDGGYRLTGEKRYVARLEQATHVVIFTRAANEKDRQLSAFVLPMKTQGLEVVHLEAHGLVGNSFGGLKFENLFVPDSQILGNDGDGVEIFNNHFRYWRLMQVAAALGTAEQALEQMADRLANREVYGGPIGRFTHLQQALGQHTTELSMAHALAIEAAKLLDNKDYKKADLLINGLKAEGVEIALNAVDAATRAFGGEGYSSRVDLGDRLRDLNGLRIADGTTDVMRMSVVANRFGAKYWNMAIRGSKTAQ